MRSSSLYRVRCPKCRFEQWQRAVVTRELQCDICEHRFDRGESLPTDEELERPRESVDDAPSLRFWFALVGVAALLFVILADFQVGLSHANFWILYVGLWLGFATAKWLLGLFTDRHSGVRRIAAATYLAVGAQRYVAVTAEGEESLLGVGLAAIAGSLLLLVTWTPGRD